MPQLEITELQNREEEKAWDEYVHNSNSSTFYHQLRSVLIKLFKSLMVEKTYKHKPVYLLAKEEGEIKGVLPLFLVKSILFGKKLVSVSFAPYGGVCTNNETVEKALVEEASRITEEYRADYLEFRGVNKNEQN